jgi:hypothetical protein
MTNLKWGNAPNKSGFGHLDFVGFVLVSNFGFRAYAYVTAW